MTLRPAVTRAQACLGLLLVTLSCVSAARSVPPTRPVASLPAVADAPAPPVSSEAMFHFLRARLLLDQGHAPEAADAVREALVFDHGSAVLYALLGEALLAQGRPGDAVAQADRALELDARAVEPHALRAAALWDAGHLEQAEPSLRQVLARAPGRYLEAQRLVELLVRRGDFKGAAEVGSALAAATGQQEDALVLVAAAGIRAGALEGAAAQLDAAFKQAPWSARVCALKADVAEQRARFEEALETRRVCLALDPQDRDTQVALLAGLARAGRSAELQSVWTGLVAAGLDEDGAVDAVQAVMEAQAALAAAELARDALLRSPASARLGVLLAQSEALVGRCAQAQDAVAMVPRAGDPGRAAALIVASCHLRRRQPRQALEVLQAARAHHPRAAGLVALECQAHRQLKDGARAATLAASLDVADGELWSARARCLVDAAQPAAAMDLAAQRLAQAPDDPEVLMAVADVQWYAHRYRESVATARQALAVRPDAPEVQNFLAYGLLRSGGDLKEARRLAEQAAARSPGSGEVADTLGEIQLALGETKKGAEQVERAAMLAPLEPEIWLHVGRARRALGNEAGALEAFRRGLTLLPPEEDVEAELHVALGPP